MDPTIPTTPIPQPTPTPTPTPTPSVTPSLNSYSPINTEGLFENGATIAGQQPSAVQPAIAPAQPAVPATPVTPASNSMPTFRMAPSVPSISSAEPFMEREPIKAPDPVKEALKAPIKAAGPVPGSIGSAVSMPRVNEAPATPAPQVRVATPTPSAQPAQPAQPTQPMSSPAQPQMTNVPFAPVQKTNSVSFSDNSNLLNTTSAPIEETKKANIFDKLKEQYAKNKVRMLLICGCIVAAILAIILVVVVFGGSSDNKTSSNSNTNPDMNYLTLSCKKFYNQNELLRYGGAINAVEYFRINYINDEMDTIEINTTVDYENSAFSTTGEKIFREEYVEKIRRIGYDTDPITSSYNLTDTSLTISHLMSKDQLDEKSKDLFSLTLDEEGKIDTTTKTVKKTYKNLGYACRTE